MATLHEDRAAAVKSADDIVTGAKAAERDLTTDEVTQVDQFIKQIDEIDGKVKAAADSQALVKRLGEMGKTVTTQNDDQGGDKPAKSLGEHYIKHAGEEFRAKRGVSGASVAAPEFKADANTDTQVTDGPSGVFGPVLTQVDRTIVHPVRPPAVVGDLLSHGTLSGTGITYFVESALQGAFTTVAEAGAKPQLHETNPTAVTDTLKKIAGFFKFSDEMAEDLDFLVTEINNRGLYVLAMFEEAQILNGGGTGTDLTGIMQRSGVQTETAASGTAAGDDNADAVFRALTKVQVGSGLPADGIVIHPTDYQAFRLSRDGNGQYFGGGYFVGEYGVGGVPAQPPLWGQRTIVTSSITAGTVLVGAFRQSATLYTKGGIRVESTNSHASDFTSNLVTTRIEKRDALAVRVPSGFCKVTLDNAAPAA